MLTAQAELVDEIYANNIKRMEDSETPSLAGRIRIVCPEP